MITRTSNSGWIFSMKRLIYLIFLGLHSCLFYTDAYHPIPEYPHSFEDSQQEEIVMALVVEARKVECLFQTIANPKHTAFEVDYQVIEGGENDINFMVKSPEGVVLVNEPKSSDGTHKIEIDQPHHGRGDYAFCFDNTFSMTSAKRVFFEIFLLDKEGNYLSDYDLKALSDNRKYGVNVQLDAFNRVTNKLKGSFNEIERMQSQMRAIEARDRSTMESNYEMVNFWSTVNLLCLVFVSVVQVYTIRSLFLEQSMVGKFVRHGTFS